MGNLRLSISMSLDGYVAGPEQSRENPLGVGGMELHEWMFPLKEFRETHGAAEGEVHASSAVVKERRRGIGATMMGRNMFAPAPGPWPDDSWRGWWGEEPPYHHAVFVLTHHRRKPLAMRGGTTFHFVSDGIEAARRQMRPPMARTSGSRGAPRWSTSTLPLGSWTRSTFRSRRLSSAAVPPLFEGLERGGLALRQLRAVDAPGVTHIKYEVD